MRRSAWMFALAAVALAAIASAAAAHPPVATSALVKIDADGRITVTVRHDALAFALNDTSLNITDAPMYELLAGPDEAMTEAFDAGRDRFADLFRLLADDARIQVQVVESPTTAAVRAWQKDRPDRRLPVKLDFVARATLPAPARRIAVRFPDILGDVIVTFDRPGAEPFTMPLAPGETSPPMELSATVPRVGAAPIRATPLSTLAVAWRFIALGFTHIVPAGPDHALFVLGLFLLCPRMKVVLWQITAFTIAHTITLTLTSLHIVGLPSSIVEPTIAASIAFIGVENLLTARVHSWRPAVAFLFGLAHGMGVATAFNEAGFPPGRLVPSLAAFTVGVEGGHIAVLAAAFLLLSWTRDRSWYRRRISIPLSLLIAAIAVFWMVQRLRGPG